ncbi:Sfrs5 protein [Aphelenchoides avenae]|nr:Sfrs5 protein [Aphelenchus avenae]
MSSARIFVGRLAHRATERDLDDFFRKSGKIRDIVLKQGFGFVEFDDVRDAEDAVYELNGRELCGERVVVEMSRRPRFGGGGGDRGGRDGGFRGPPPRGGGGAGGGRYGPPQQTPYRLLVENLSTRYSWQDLKDLLRGAGDVAYADAHRKEPNVATVCFMTHDGLKRAIDKYQGKDINGRKIKLTDETDSRDIKSRKSRSRSPRSRSPRSRSRSRSDSRSRSPVQKRSKGDSRSRSRSAS